MFQHSPQIPHRPREQSTPVLAPTGPVAQTHNEPEQGVAFSHLYSLTGSLLREQQAFGPRFTKIDRATLDLIEIRALHNALGSCCCSELGRSVLLRSLMAPPRERSIILARRDAV